MDYIRAKFHGSSVFQSKVMVMVRGALLPTPKREPKNQPIIGVSGLFWVSFKRGL